METFLITVVFFSIAIMIFAFSSAAAAPSSTVQHRLRSVMGSAAVTDAGERGIAERFEDVLESVSRAVPQSPEELSKTRLLLTHAGYREPRHVNIYLGLRVLFALIGLAVGLMLITSGGMLVGVSLALLGYFVPRFVLKRRISSRQRKIKLSLPDALDLAVVCVEAGLSLDQALQRVALELEHAHPELSDELRLVNLEIRAGKPRTEALRNLASRTAVDDVRAVVAVLVQTDRFGTSLSAALRVHSDALRTERRQRAEEAAAKTTIKMVPVLVFFVLPPMFIVTIGPAIIQLMRVVMPEVNQ